MAYKRAGSRRSFLQQAGLSGVALTIGCYWPAAGKRVSDIVHIDDANETAIELMNWITLGSDGQVTIFTHRSKMGQGTWQVIPQIIAEERAVNLDQVTVRFASANPQKYGPQPQDGSFSIRGWYLPLLQMGASAREMLIEAAANQWHVDKTECYAENGQVVHRNTKKSFPTVP